MLKIHEILHNMAVESTSVPNAPSFEQAIALTQSLLDQIEQDTIPEQEVEQTIATLVGSENGARGFFVTYLSDERPLVEHMFPVVARALSVAPEVISPLMVKNLAMSTAMGIAHRRNQSESLAQGSDLVRSRAAHIVQALSLPQLQAEAEKLAASIDTGTGAYQSFLQRWGYDVEQQQAIREALLQSGLLDSH